MHSAPESGIPLVVIAAPNGARLGKGDHPRIPLSAAEIAFSAGQLADCGVCLLHLHVRDRNGGHSLDAGLYREALAGINETVGDRLIVQVTTEAVGQYDRFQQMDLVRTLRPEAVSLALRELCPDESAEEESGAFFRELAELRVWPQYIIYSPEECARFERLRAEGFFGAERPFALFVLGRYATSRRGEPEQLDEFLAQFRPGAFPWAVCCFGAAEPEAVRRAAARGGHVRIGFENNRALPNGAVARDNAELVRAELAYIRTAGVQREPATAAWLRQQLVAGRF